MPVFIALLRAVNVAGTGKVPMKALKAACEEIGLEKVSTYVASGNIVFATGKSETRVRALLSDMLQERFGLANHRVILRTPEDLKRVIGGNPFASAARSRPKLLMVKFLESIPVAGAAAAISALNYPERLHLAGQHLYVDYVEGVSESKLTPALLDKILGVRHTSRNWNTTQKLLEMASEIEEPNS